MGSGNTEHHTAHAGRRNMVRCRIQQVFPNPMLPIAPGAWHATTQIPTTVFMDDDRDPRCLLVSCLGSGAQMNPCAQSSHHAVKCQLACCAPVGHPQPPPYESPLHPRHLLTLLLFLEGSPLLAKVQLSQESLGFWHVPVTVSLS